MIVSRIALRQVNSTQLSLALLDSCLVLFYSILKIERVTTIFVNQVEAKSQIHNIFKSQNLSDFFDISDPIFFSGEVNLYS